MKRSKRSRNFWGGFFGGVLGVLLTGLLSPFLLPVGCLVGFLVGYWYYEIFRSARYTWHKNLPSALACRLMVLAFRKLEEGYHASIQGLKRFWQVSRQVFKWTLVLLRGSVLWPVCLWRWMNDHPVHEARALRALASLVALFIAGGVLYSMRGLVPPSFFSGDAFPALAEMLAAGSALGFVAGTILGLVFVAFVGFLDRKNVMDANNEKARDRNRSYNWYLEYQAFCRWKGAVGWFLRNLGICLALPVLGTVVGAVLLPAVFFVGLPVMAAVIIGGMSLVLFSSFVYGLLIGLYKVSRKHGHWIGFTTTFAVTVLTVATAWPILSGTALWLIALLNGAVCGYASMATVVAVHRFFERNEELVLALYQEEAPASTSWPKAFWRAICGKPQPVHARIS